jgi:uncharacterized integral membrane protein
MQQDGTLDCGGAVPYQLCIGVTGHRALPRADSLATVVASVLARIVSLVPPSPATTVRLTVISPLAEGADRVVARQVLAQPQATLEAVLPLPVSDYQATFSSEESRQEFRDLLAAAATLTELPSVETHGEAYEQAGQYVVERCDVLVALWDGQPAHGQGGTANIVGLARDRGVPVFWIHTDPPFACTEWLGNGLDVDAYRALDDFNRAPIRAAHMAAAVERSIADYCAQAERAGLDPAVLRPYCSWSVPAFVRADLLATRAQRRFFQVSDATFILGALAVIASAGPQLVGRGSVLAGLGPHSSLRLAPLIESLLMVLGLLAIYLGRRQGYHRRWILYRYLAERLRSALFLALVTPPEPTIRSPEPEALHHSAERWLERAYDVVWQSRPAAEPQCPIVGLRRFLIAAWVAHQRAYQARKSRRHEVASEWIARLGTFIFLMTLAFAVTHAFDVGQGGVLWETVAPAVLFMSIILPAVAGALSGIGALREHPRNARRSDRMARYLARLEARMAHAPDLTTLRTLTRLVEATTLQETGDWLVTMELRDLGL